MIWLWDLLQLMLSPSDGFLLFDFFSHKIELRRCLFAVLIGRVRSEVSTGPSYVFQSLSLHSFTILIIYLPLVHIRCLLVRQNVCQDYQRAFFTRLFRPQEYLLFSAIQEIWRQWRFFFLFLLGTGRFSDFVQCWGVCLMDRLRWEKNHAIGKGERR